MPLLKASLEAVLEAEPALSEEAHHPRVPRHRLGDGLRARDRRDPPRTSSPPLLFNDEDMAILSDFGVARAVAGYVSTTGKQLVLGTPHYISPEQARGQPLDGRTDIYSLGVTMYRAATGELPSAPPTGTSWPGCTWSSRPRRRARASRALQAVRADHPDLPGEGSRGALPQRRRAGRRAEHAAARRRARCAHDDGRVRHRRDEEDVREEE